MFSKTTLIILYFPSLASRRNKETFSSSFRLQCRLHEMKIKWVKKSLFGFGLRGNSLRLLWIFFISALSFRRKMMMRGKWGKNWVARFIINNEFSFGVSFWLLFFETEGENRWGKRVECDVCWEGEMKLFFRIKLHPVVLCTYFLIIHLLFVHEGGTVGSLYWYFFSHSLIRSCTIKEQKIINFFLQFSKTFFPPPLLVFPLWDFPRFSSSISIFGINKARTYFFTDVISVFATTQKKENERVENPLRDAALSRKEPRLRMWICFID